jgi:hypothetical protein
MRRICRLVVRDTDDPNDGLIIGAKLKGTDNPLEPGDVWEIREILGELVLKKIGKSHIPARGEYSWNVDISDLLLYEKQYLFLTKEEYECQEQEKIS